MGMYGSAPEAPDYGPIADAQMALGNRSLALMEEAYAYAREQGDQIFAQSQAIADQAMSLQEEQANNARYDRQRYENEIVPLEQQYIQEAQGYDTADRRSAAAGAAISDVGAAFDAERASAERKLAGYGIDPSMLRSGALDLQSRIGEATAKAGAGTSAMRYTEDTGRAMRESAINMGRGLPAQSIAAVGGSNQSGGTASGAGTGAVGTANGAIQGSATFGGLAAQGYGGAAQALNYGYSNSLAAYEANQQYGLPGILQTVAGGAAGFGVQKMFGAEGGAIPVDASPSRGKVQDDITMNVSGGEYIIPPEVVKWKGEEFFEKLKQQVMDAKGTVNKAKPNPVVQSRGVPLHAVN